MTAKTPPDETVEELYEEALCGYVTTDPDGRVLKVNRTFSSWIGYGKDQLVQQRRIQDLLTIGARVFYDTHYRPLLHMQGFAHEIALDLVCADGRQLPILVNASLKTDADGGRYHRMTIFNAVQRRQYERELLLARRRAEQASKAKDDVIAMLSHDVRTPLGNIQLATTMLARADLPEPAQRYLRVLKNASDGLLALVNAVLDHSRLQAGTLGLQERAVSLRPFVEETVRGLRLKAEEKRIALRTEVDERLPDLVMLDAVKMGQVLTNLLGNAVKFTENGSVTLTVQLGQLTGSEASIDFAVSDTGMGIPADRLPHVFEEFTQADSSIRAQFGGSGLGLAICRKILELYGSHITVESTVGQGSTFSFTLPLRLADPTHAAAQGR